MITPRRDDLDDDLREESAFGLEARFRQVLPRLDPTQVQALFETVSGVELDRLEEPKTGLIMINAVDAFGETFHLGETLATVAEAAAGGLRGHATVMGDEPQKAALAATLNVLIRCPDNHAALAAFRRVLADCARSVDERRREEDRMIAATRVRFETMAPENV